MTVKEATRNVDTSRAVKGELGDKPSDLCEDQGRRQEALTPPLNESMLS